MKAWSGILVAFSMAVLAAPVVLADGADTPAYECQSCNARHKALQNLQQARTGEKPAEATTTSPNSSTDNNALTALPPEPQSQAAQVTE